MSNTRENEVIIIMHGQEVLRLEANGDIVFQGNFIAKDVEANKRFLVFFKTT